MSFPDQKSRRLLSRHWGHEEFYDFQKKTIASILENRDTLTVIPTGGGKSLCFQFPALLMQGTALVISPLISLMQDQVDSLAEQGIEAESLNSSLSPTVRRSILKRLDRGEIDLLYIAPERFEMERMRKRLSDVHVPYAVVDEAHCISHWGHDFRDSYRNLDQIKQTFPETSVHAFTATATPKVQQDIVQQLSMEDPEIHVGDVDRPNLTYRVRRRSRFNRQVKQLLSRHEGEAGIIYCLRRKDVDRLTEHLHEHDIDALPYHAGMSDQKREEHQDQFMSGQSDLVVATIAFGMGVDRSNIRFIIHAAMPKTLEHYHQETGRAGRDGRPASCYLFFSGGDYGTWKSILSDSKNREVMTDKLNRMYRYCTQPRCRHRVLVEYFGQALDEPCEACDYCLRELDEVEEPLVVGQKILSCVVRVHQQFGAQHVADVLKGKRTDQVERWGHQDLSTFGLMSDRKNGFLRHMIDQLQGQGFLERSSEYRTLSVTERGRDLLSGDDSPRLVKPMTREKKKEVREEEQRQQVEEWEEADEELFEHLRQTRRDLANERDVPAFVIFSDRSLKEMSARKPSSKEEFRAIHGVGDVKLERYGEIFLDAIRAYKDR